MVDKEVQRLRKMGLTKLTKNDTFVEHEDEWGDKKYLFDELVTVSTNLWRIVHLV